mmetsp:Transcript_9883/g.12873  ORF Transcript_9883/g.12873 Transcript_9883/m.12873 type:complete len:253 (+) Transcript_9883:168-926(+)
MNSIYIILSIMVGCIGSSLCYVQTPMAGTRGFQQIMMSVAHEDNKNLLSRKSFNHGMAAALLVPGLTFSSSPASAEERYTSYPALRGEAVPKAKYPDFIETESGLQIRDKKIGDGEGSPTNGDRVVIDWEGYTIGYFGRPFEAKRTIKGGAFDKDSEYVRFVLGRGTVIPAIEEAVKGMSKGGVRQIIIPPELGYPANDPSHKRVGPKPTTFSGERALNFVLENQGMIDKTLLMNLTLVRYDKPGERGFTGK